MDRIVSRRPPTRLIQRNGTPAASAFEKGIYPFAGEGDNGPRMVNIGLPSRSGGDAFRAAVTGHWLPALEAFAPQRDLVPRGRLCAERPRPRRRGACQGTDRRRL